MHSYVTALILVYSYNNMLRRKNERSWREKNIKALR